MTPLSALIDRLAQATGPDRGLDRAIAAALGATSTYDLATCQEYTKSVDEALTLVPEGWNWDISSMSFMPSKKSWAKVWKTRNVHQYNSFTPALALCLATLRAIDSGRTE